MIKLNKTNAPDVLNRNTQKWTEELLAAIAQGIADKKNLESRYRHDDIKDALIAETFGKCAYCDSKILHVDFGDIEHIFPKSVFPEKSFSWNNLTLACKRCNNKKGNYYCDDASDNGGALLNPYVDDPEKFLIFLADHVFAYGNAGRGRMTIEKFDLSRSELVERRREALADMLFNIEVIRQAPAQMQDVIMRDFHKRHLSNECEFLATRRNCVQDLVRRGVLPP